MWQQKQIQLNPYPRGFHLITEHIVHALPNLKNYRVGLAHILLQHTSASLTVNENADQTVRQDFEHYFSKLAKENEAYYSHTDEGSDDMPAHLKASLLGCSITLPISNGRLTLGTWQGIYLGEHRNDGGSRRLVVTLQGE